MYARFVFPVRSDASDPCNTYSLHGYGVSRDGFRDFAERLTVYPADGCAEPQLPFRPTFVLSGFSHAVIPGGGPGSEDAADNEDWVGNKGFYLGNSTRERGPALYRGVTAWSPAANREEMDVLGTRAWVDAFPEGFVVDFFYQGGGEACDFFSIVGKGITKSEIRRFAQGLVSA
jgi:hypothetical protein